MNKKKLYILYYDQNSFSSIRSLDCSFLQIVLWRLLFQQSEKPLIHNVLHHIHFYRALYIFFAPFAFYLFFFNLLIQLFKRCSCCTFSLASSLTYTQVLHPTLILLILPLSFVCRGTKNCLKKNIFFLLQHTLNFL